MIERCFEDHVPGTTSEHDTMRVTTDEIVDIGRRFDQQPFHVDADAAAAGPFGGLIASGWHTCALMMRLLAEEYLPPASSLGSPGADELRWIQSVRPGDELTLRATVEDGRVSRSRPDRGIVRTPASHRCGDPSGQSAAVVRGRRCRRPRAEAEPALASAAVMDPA